MINLNLYGYSTDANSFVNKVTQLQSKISNLVSNTINDDKNGLMDMFKLFVSSKDFETYKNTYEYKSLYSEFNRLVSPFSNSEFWNIWKMGDLHIESDQYEGHGFINNVKVYIVDFSGNIIINVFLDEISIEADDETGDERIVVSETETKTNKTNCDDNELGAMVRELFESFYPTEMRNMFELLV